MTLAKLKNPTMSSSQKGSTADRALRRQFGQSVTPEELENQSKPYDWGVHADWTTNEFVESSCAVTSDAKSNDTNQFW